VSVNVYDCKSKPYCFGLPAMTTGEGLTNPLKARDPELRCPIYGNVNNGDSVMSSVLDVPSHPLGVWTKSFTPGISESPGAPILQTLRSSPLNPSPSKWVF